MLLILHKLCCYHFDSRLRLVSSSKESVKVSHFNYNFFSDIFVSKNGFDANWVCDSRPEQMVYEHFEDKMNLLHCFQIALSPGGGFLWFLGTRLGLGFRVSLSA